MLKKLFDKSLLYFLLIGVGNTLLSMGIMFLLYKVGFGYWGSSAVAFTVTSILSFLLNKKLSFQYEGHVWAAALRFALVIAVCYLLAYSVAQPATGWLLQKFLGTAVEAKTIDKVALLTGQVIFTGLNYFGQRFFAFRKA